MPCGSICPASDALCIAGFNVFPIAKPRSRLYMKPSSTAFLTSLSPQLFSAAFPSSFSQQLFPEAFLSHHLAVVRGWWSAIDIILLWSGVGGQLLTSSCCGQGLVVRYCNYFAVVRGWSALQSTHSLKETLP